MFRDPLYGLIDEYVTWYAERYQLVAGTRKALLYRFARSHNLKSISDIREDHIAFFVGEELTEFYAEQALKAIRNFLWYAVMTGHKCISYKMATKEYLTSSRGRPRNQEMTKEVKSLREGKTPLSYRAIKRNLDEKYKRNFSVKSIYRWAQYQ